MFVRSVSNVLIAHFGLVGILVPVTNILISKRCFCHGLNPEIDVLFNHDN